MQILLINEIAGQIGRLQAVLEQARAAEVGAIFALGNITPATDDRQAPIMPMPGQASPFVREPASALAHYIRTLDVLATLDVPVCLVPGRHDIPLLVSGQILAAAQGAGRARIFCRRAVRLDDRTIIIGCGGSPAVFPGPCGLLLLLPLKEPVTAFECHTAALPFFHREEIRIVLLAAALHRAGAIQPDTVPRRGLALNRLLQTWRPQLICCGGPRRGRVTVTDGALHVTPGTLATGSYALIDLDRLTARLRQMGDTAASSDRLPSSRAVGAIE